ncbi:MAG TPA: hypothetical protein VFJ94_10320 [Intrasporangium sp.]|uniref:hypothetical protein n=1 Tax=Intrasporangium sp. TaxID=1925024 RepID=UPI002D765765|nr:hypothetical protein [Intrasporangium sp.]HET7398904.1 hypothetical protein [Intrasporangium sp.]
MPLRLRHGRAAALVIGAALAALGAPSALTAPASAAPAFCSLTGMQKNVWTGAAGDGLWVTPGNWSRNRAPDLTDRSTGYVCIDAHGPVTMAAGESAELQAIDVATGTTLNLQRGSTLLVHGDQATRPSYLRGGSVTALSGTLGGPGRIELLGRLTWTSTTLGASTITTRRCGTGGTCGAAVTGPRGLLVVGDNGLVDVTPLGVNLFDQYQLKVRGTLRLRGTAYVAADRGTSLELLPRTTTTGVGTLLITNNGGWYEGRTLYGVSALSAVTNAGLVHKSAGTGTSVVVGSYTRAGAGTIRVGQGTLSMPDQVRHAVTVGSTDAYGFGACNGSSYACEPVADAQQPQTGTIRVPASDADGALIELAPDGPGPAGTLGEQVHAGATGMTVSSTDPAVLGLRYDTSVLGGRTWRQLVVERAPTGTTSYAIVPACPSSGEPPTTGIKACVDRRGLATSSRTLPDGDALMVVRTTGFSRWRAR